MASTRKAIVQDFGSYDIRPDMSREEVRRLLTSLLGAPWLGSATICELQNGDLEFKRPAAAPKG